MMPLFAQGAADEYDPGVPAPEPYYDSPFHWLYWPSFGLLSLAYTAFTIWMLVECVRKDPDRYIWIWVILWAYPFGGPVIYFVARWLPSNDFRAPRFVRRWFQSKELHRIEAAAQQIGNPYHHVQLGDALREAGHFDRAGQAYLKALAKEPQNLQALWGAALVDIERKQHDSARGRLEQLLALDAHYKFGDVSLAYGRTLCNLSRPDEAQTHLEKHVRRWRHPEGVYLLATLYLHFGRTEDARTQLDALLLDIHGSPRAIARKQTLWKSRARKLLRKLPRNG